MCHVLPQEAGPLRGLEDCDNMINLPLKAGILQKQGAENSTTKDSLERTWYRRIRFPVKAFQGKRFKNKEQHFFTDN